MATQAVYHEQHHALTRTVRRWDRRLRLNHTLVWLPRSLMPGLALGIAVAVISRFRPWLLPNEILLVTGFGVVVGLVVMLLAVWLWPRPALAAARRFDLLFGLNERVSTALELLEGRIQTSDEFTARQVDDAWTRVQTVQPRTGLPLQTHGREWLFVLVLAGLLALLVLLPNALAETVAANDAQQAAIEEAAEDLRDITERVAADPNLEDVDRESLLQALERSIETLEQPNVTPEEAFAAVSDVQGELQNRADQFDQALSQNTAAMRSAAEQLGNLSPEMQQALEDAQNEADAMRDMMEQLQQQMNSMTPEQQQQAAAALQGAGQQMEQANPQAAQQMQQAGQSLQNGQTQQAQAGLQQAQQSMEQGQQAQQQQQAAQQELSESAQQAQQAAQEVAESGQQQQQGQQSQQQNQQGQQGQQQGQEQQGQPGQQGDQAGQQGDSQQPGEQGQQGQQGEGQQEGESSSPSDSSSPNSQQGESQQGSSGSNAGDQSSGAGNDQGGQEQQGPPEANNNPDGQGESQFAPVYAPQRIGGEPGGEEIILEADDGDAPVVQGEFSENPTGNSVVPYNQVFADYADQANRALDSDYIPLGLRDVIRNYFTSLEPENQ